MNDPDDDLIRRARALPREEPPDELRGAIQRSARKAERSAGWVRFGLAASLALLGVLSSSKNEARVKRLIAGSESEVVTPLLPDTGLASRVLAAAAQKRARSFWILRTQLADLEKRS